MAAIRQAAHSSLQASAVKWAEDGADVRGRIGIRNPHNLIVGIDEIDGLGDNGEDAGRPIIREEAMRGDAQADLTPRPLPPRWSGTSAPLNQLQVQERGSLFSYIISKLPLSRKRFLLSGEGGGG